MAGFSISSSGGDGEYVDITGSGHHPSEVAPGFVDGTNILSNRFSLTDIIIDELKTKLSGDLTLLTEFLTTALPTNWQDILDLTIPEPVGIIKTKGPTLRTLLLDYDWPTDPPVLGKLQEIPMVDFSFDTPEKPTDVVPSLDYVAKVYVSPMWDSLFNKIYDGVVNGGTGLNSETEQAIYDRAIDRQALAHSEEYQKMIDAASSDGFDFAGGAQASILLTFAKRRMQEETNLNNDIIKMSADLTQNNTQFILTQAAALEDMLREFYLDDERRILEAKKAIVEYAIEKVKANIQLYIAEWDGVKAEMQAKISQLDVAKSYNEAVAMTFDAQMRGYTAEIDATAKKISGDVEAYKGEVAGFVAELQERGEWWKARTEEERTKLMRWEQMVKLAIAEADILIKSTLDFNQFKESVLETMTNVVAQVLASALGSGNVSISHGTNISESLSETTSFGASIGEDHNFDNTAT